MKIPDENFQTNKVGVRLNGDFDNGGSSRDWFISAVVSTENDLIRTDISIAPPPESGGGLKYVLKKSSDRITFWKCNKKGTSSYSIPSSGKLITTSDTLWAEWSQNVHGTCNFSLEAIEVQTGKVIAKREFDYRSFKSVTAAFVGENEQAGNPTVSSGVNDWVIQELLNGYDVWVFDDGYDVFTTASSDCTNWGEGNALNVVANAINNQGITDVAIIGYSHGGGSAYNLAWRMFYDGGTSDSYLYWYPPQVINNPYNLVFTSYIDAVPNSHSLNGIEADSLEVRPYGSLYHLNQYETNSWVGGCSIPTSDENIDRSIIDGGVVYHSGGGETGIDTNSVIQNHLKVRFEQHVSR
jgi:hypothetical protein